MEKENDNGSSISTPEIWKWEMAGKNRRWCCKGHTKEQPVPLSHHELYTTEGLNTGATSCCSQCSPAMRTQTRFAMRVGLLRVMEQMQLHPTHTNPTALLLSCLPKKTAMLFSSVRIIFVYFRANEQSAPQSQFNSSSPFCAVTTVAELMHALSYMLPTCSLENLWYQSYVTWLFEYIVKYVLHIQWNTVDEICFLLSKVTILMTCFK